MSCIVGVIEGNKVFMGADSAGTAPQSLEQVSCKTPKIYTEGNFIIGMVGSYRGIQLMKDYLDLEKREEIVREVMPDARPYEVISGIVNDMRNIFIDYGFTETKEGRENGGHFLIGYRAGLYLIQPEYDITEPAYPFYSIGNGDMAAFGALYAMADSAMEPVERIKLALSAAQEFSAAVREPWVIDSVGE